MTENLRIGVPSKGRLAELSTELLKDAGLSFRRQDRSLFARVKDMPIDVTFLRTDDIPTLCAEGAIDLGNSAGSDRTGVMSLKKVAGLGKAGMSGMAARRAADGGFNMEASGREYGWSEAGTVLVERQRRE